MLDQSDRHQDEDLKTFLDRLFGNTDIVAEIEKEISSLQSQVVSNFKLSNIDRASLAELRDELTEGTKRLIQAQDELNLFYDSPEVSEITESRRQARERQVKIDHVLLFDKFFDTITKLNQSLTDSKERFQERDYVLSQQCIVRATDLHLELDKMKTQMFAEDSSLLKDADLILGKLLNCITSVTEEFTYELILLFKQNVSLDCDEKVFNNRFSTSMSLDQYQSYIQCILTEKDEFRIYFRNIFDQINRVFVQEILENSKKTIMCNNEWPQVTLVDSNDVTKKPLDHLYELIQHVLNTFTMENSIESSSELVKLIGDIWCNSILNCCINFYFERLMPKDEAEFEKYLDLLSEGTQLEAYMQSLGMVNPEEQDYNSAIQEYIKDIKNHFSTKICQDFIIRMKKSLKANTGEEVSSDVALKGFPYTSAKTKFSVCLVNEHMLKIRDLLQEMATLLQQSSINLKLLLVETMYNVCELFITISPYLAREQIEIDSRRNAIFHNDCLFFGFLVEAIALFFKPELDLLFELVPVVRNMASQVFLQQMREHEKVLLSILKGASFKASLREIANEIPSSDLKTVAESHHAFRECLNASLKHLNYLRTAFHSTLPEKIYNRVFSTLISIYLKELIASIVALDDISSLGSSHLSNEIKYFSDELKLFLVDSEEVIFRWMKLNEVNFVLKSSLLEIMNRWSAGSGVLATYLTADEVKHLIRALFQNNERRANVLARIK